MKIKTITCHEVYNYGASLQEYALLKYLKNQGYEAETIHYKPSYLSGHFNLWDTSHPFFNRNIILKGIFLLLKLPKRLINLKRKKAFDKFSKEHIKTGEKLYKSNNELIENLPEADTYICGSDQIWNSFFENGKDPAFYLDFVPDNKLKLSYAASFAIDELEDDIKEFVKSKIARLDYISTRESSGKRIVQNLGFDNVTQVLDPVFLLDQKEWYPLMNKELTIKEKYIIVYDFDNDPLIENLAKRLKKEHGFKIYAFNQLINYADENLYLKGPDVFLKLAKNAESILANSFHAVAFSLIFKRNLAVFNRSDKINTRMRDMLGSVGLSNFLIENETMTNDYKLNTIDYEEVHIKLNVLIQKSKNYLDNALVK